MFLARIVFWDRHRVILIKDNHPDDLEERLCKEFPEAKDIELTEIQETRGF